MDADECSENLTHHAYHPYYFVEIFFMNKPQTYCKGTEASLLTNAEKAINFYFFTCHGLAILYFQTMLLEPNKY